jgi:ATPase subunit of ABC transporter with duplicated ATPase domains
MRLRGGRTGVRALTCEGLTLHRLTEPFDLEVFYGERVAVLGGNGTGKSPTRQSRIIGRACACRPIENAQHAAAGGLAEAGRGRPRRRLEAGRAVPPHGHFSQTHERPDLAGRTLLDILWKDCALQPEEAARVLNRYELTPAREQRFDTLSGGQQARLQILLLELSGATMLLLDEPTDNLDVASAEALETALAEFDGTVLAVTHDRWFTRSFDRFVSFRADGRVAEVAEPAWL